MELYVCYTDYGMYEGCAEPSAVFSTHELAQKYCDEKNKNKSNNMCYVKLLLDEGL